MTTKEKKTINFLVTANIYDSVNRLVLEWSNCLIKKEFNIVISYPVFPRWDYLRWQVERATRQSDNKFMDAVAYYTRLFIRLAGGYRLPSTFINIIKYFLNRYLWAGKKMGEIDSRVKFNNYLLYPTNRNMPNSDYIVMMNGGYPIPHLIYLKPEKGQIFNSIHLNYTFGLRDSVKDVREWWAYVLNIERRLNVYSFTESTKNMRVAKQAGVKVCGTVPPGVNIKQFTDSGRRGEIIPLKVTLYCDPRSQKGLDFGVAIIRKLKEERFENVVYCSIGRLKPEYVGLFDIKWDFLYRDEYPKALRETDIFIYPSLYDGFGAPPQQAMASGCALVTTNIDGTDEYGVHQENCMMAMPTDLETMVDNVKRLIIDIELRDRIRENGLLTVKKYSWEASADKLIKLLNENTVSYIDV